MEHTLEYTKLARIWNLEQIAWIRIPIKIWSLIFFSMISLEKLIFCSIMASVIYQHLSAQLIMIDLSSDFPKIIILKKWKKMNIFVLTESLKTKEIIAKKWRILWKIMDHWFENRTFSYHYQLFWFLWMIDQSYIYVHR